MKFSIWKDKETNISIMTLTNGNEEIVVSDGKVLSHYLYSIITYRPSLLKNRIIDKALFNKVMEIETSEVKQNDKYKIGLVKYIDNMYSSPKVVNNLLTRIENETF